MNQLILTAIFLGNLYVTSYRSVPTQTDSSPWITATGERVTVRGCAVSQDFITSGELKYGDLLYIEGIGYRFINDTMNKRCKHQIDVWVLSAEEETKFDKKFKGKKLSVWVVYNATKAT